MMPGEKILNLLGLCRRAGKLVTGEDLVLDAVRKQAAFMVIMAEDTGPATQKKVKDKCQTYKTPLYCHFSKAELSQAIGQNRSILAVVDSGFAKSFKQLFDEVS